MTFLKKYWPLVLILIAGFLTRIWHIETLFYFTYDESIPAFVGRRLILWQHLPLIGGATPFGFHLSPYFYWFYAALLFIGKLNPLVWGYTAAFLSILTTFFIFKVGESIDSPTRNQTLELKERKKSIYIVGKNFGGKRVAITAAIFWAFSYLANIYDRHLWALFWGPLTSLFVLYFLGKIAIGRQKFIYPLALTIGLSIHADPSNLVFLGLAIAAFIYKKIPLKKNLAIIFIFIGLLLTPLVAFDLRHNFANTRPVLDFIKTGSNQPAIRTEKFIQNSLLFPQAATRLIYKFGDDEVAKQYSYCRNFVAEKFNAIPQALILLSVFLILAFIFLSFKAPQNPLSLVSYLLLLYFLGIQLYGTLFGGDIFEHYITGLFPAFILIAAFFVSRLPRKLWLLALGLFVAANLYKLSLAKNSQGLIHKRQAIEYVVQKVGDKSFSLDSLSTCWKWNGYRYLFAVFGREPTKSYVDPNFGYLYGTTPIAEKHPPTVIAFVVHDFAPETPQYYSRYALLKSHEVFSKTFGSIEVIIMDNTSGWFDNPNSSPQP